MKTSLRLLPGKEIIYIISTVILMLFVVVTTSTLLAPSAEAVACACNDHCNGHAPDTMCSVHKGCNSNKTGICQQCPQAGSPQGCPNNQICRNNANGKNICVPQNNPPPPDDENPPPINSNICQANNADIMLVLDNSNSMAGGDLSRARAAAIKFVHVVSKNPNMRVGLATFDNNGGVTHNLTNKYQEVINSIQNQTTGGKGGTCLECAIDGRGSDDVFGAFARAGNNGNARHVIILTDGRINRWITPSGEIKGSTNAGDEKTARDQAFAAIGRVSNNHHAVFWVAQYGGASNKGWLQKIVNTYIGGQGTYSNEQSSGSLESIYTAIANELVGSTITGYVYDDKDKNGMSGPTEPPLTGVSVDLADGTKVTTKVSGADGKVVFDKLCATRFILSAKPPTGYTPSPPNSNTLTFDLPLGTSTSKTFGFLKESGPDPDPDPTEDLSFSFTVALHGIGIAGDNVLLRPPQCKNAPSATGSATACLSNQMPLHPDRDFSVEMINALNKVVATMSGTLKYSTSSGMFTAQTATPSGVTKGAYTFRVMTPMYLKKKVLFTQTVEPGKDYTLPTIDLTSSDVDADNVLTILDYNRIISCYQYPNQQNPCSEEAVKAVDNDDNGVIDEYNINLFVRDVSAIQGD